jgi:hypothetical protein
MLWPWIYIVGEGGDVDFLLLETIFSVISTAYVMSAVWLYVISSGEMLYSVYKIGRPKKETHTARTSFPAVMMFLLTIQKVYIYTTHCIYRRCSWFSFVLFLALSFFSSSSLLTNGLWWENDADPCDPFYHVHRKIALKKKGIDYYDVRGLIYRLVWAH